MDFSNVLSQPLFYLSCITLAVWFILGCQFVYGMRSLSFLRDVPTFRGTSAPKVSILMAARNEARNIEAAVRSLMTQQYEPLEVCVVNDRSTDATPEILQRLSQEFPSLQIINLTELPRGWIGKNYALYRGTQRATGELLLFTDGDVIMEPSAVSRAVHYLLETRADHLAVAPEVTMPGVFLDMFVSAFTLLVGVMMQPWKVRNAKSKTHVGIGAFNLVRANVYQAVGTHRSIAMRPDDDLKLGKIIKQAGFHQRLVLGRETIAVEWYASLRELIEGLLKNAFAAVAYRVWVVFGLSAGIVIFHLWPFAAVFVSRGSTQLIYGAVVLIILMLAYDNASFFGFKRWYGIGFPLAALLMLIILWASTITTILNKGITWRETKYSLDELRANKV